MEGMLSAQANQPAASSEVVLGAASPSPNGAANGPADGATTDPSKPACSASECLLREGSQASLKFATAISSKTAADRDPVEFVLDEDLKVGDAVVVPKGAHATATVSNAKKAGMMGKPGQLNVQLQYLTARDNHIRLRGTKGREGDSKTGATVALVVLFGLSV